MCDGPERDLSRSVEEWIVLLDAPRLEDARSALVNLARSDSSVVEQWLAACRP